MSIENRLKQVEISRDRAIHNRLKSLSDDELRRIAYSGTGSDCYGEWLKTLTDDEIEIIVDGKPGAGALQQQFDEYQKTSQKN
jgi:4-diphosphocytidyl-2C-methyl-D-erythritol kinase